MGFGSNGKIFHVFIRVLVWGVCARSSAQASKLRLVGLGRRPVNGTVLSTISNFTSSSHIFPTSIRNNPKFMLVLSSGTSTTRAYCSQSVSPKIGLSLMLSKVPFHLQYQPQFPIMSSSIRPIEGSAKADFTQAIMRMRWASCYFTDALGHGLYLYSLNKYFQRY